MVLLKRLLRVVFPWLPGFVRRVRALEWLLSLKHLVTFRKYLSCFDVDRGTESIRFVFLHEQDLVPVNLRKSLASQYYQNYVVCLKNQYVEVGVEDEDWVCFMHSDLSLFKGSLAWLAKNLENEEAVLAVYSDHFKSYGFGFVSPVYKPAWSPEYFAECDYIAPALWIKGVYSTKITSFQDIAPLLLEQPAGSVKHAAIPLYLTEYKPSLRQHALPVPHARVTKKISTLTIIIPTYNGLAFLKPCVESVLASLEVEGHELSVFVIDNRSDDPETLDYLEQLNSNPSVRVERFDAPFNFSKMNNWAANKCKTDAFVFLNNDTKVISTDWLTVLLRSLENPEIGCVGAKLFYPNNLVQHAGVVMGYGGGADHAFKFSTMTDNGYQFRLVTAQNYSAVTAACLAVRRDVFEQVGGFDEGLMVAFNDVDLCLKVRESGFRNVWLPGVQLCHYESPSRGQDDTPEKAARFNSELDILKERWALYIENDPAYSPFLAKNRHDFFCAKEIDDAKGFRIR